MPDLGPNVNFSGLKLNGNPYFLLFLLAVLSTITSVALIKL